MQRGQFARHTLILLPLFLIIFIIASCAPLNLATCALTLGLAEPPRQGNDFDPRSYYIVVHRSGSPADHHGRKIKKGLFVKDYTDKIREGFARYVNDTRVRGKGEPARLLLYVHGGLNTYRQALKRVEELTYKRKEADLRLFGPSDESKGTKRYQSRYYPVFVVWEASFSTAVCDDIFRVRAGVEDRRWAVPTSPFILTKRFGESLSGAPSSVGSMSVDLAEGFDGKQALGENLTINVPLFPVRFLTAPLIQAFGGPAWQMLYRRTDFMVKKPVRKEKEEGAVGILMEELMCDSKKAASCIKIENKKLMWISEESDKHNPNRTTLNPVPVEITLVGHSMGTLVLDSIIQEFSQIPFRRIVYLASASSIADVRASVIPYLSDKDSKFYAYTLSRGNEAREIQGWLLPQGSLLVWIDSFLSSVYTPNQLRFGRRRNLDKVGFKSPPDIKYKIEIGTFRGEEGEPKRHGDFDKAEILPRILCTIDSSAFQAECQPYKNIEYFAH